MVTGSWPEIYSGFFQRSITSPRTVKSACSPKPTKLPKANSRNMKLNNQKNRILFFIGSFKGGGKERRLIELLSYLAGTLRYEIMVVVTDPIVDYSAFYNLNIT